MLQRPALFFVFMLATSFCSAQVNPAPGPMNRTIALTFDDVTKGDGPFFTGIERTRLLIKSLSDAGHTLGNHSHSHEWLSRMVTSEYVADLDLAIQNLHQQENLTSFYRFPFLDEGRSIEKRDEFREALVARDLRNGYVTVDTYDWYLDGLAKEANSAGIDIDLDDLRDLYVDVIVSSTEFYDAMAQEVLNRSPHHVLLLHENDLAAMFIGDLVTELNNRGFRVIAATEAFRDPIADREPDTVFLGQGRVAALAHEAGLPRDELVSPTEDETYLKRRFEVEVVELSSP